MSETTKQLDAALALAVEESLEAAYQARQKRPALVSLKHRSENWADLVIRGTPFSLDWEDLEEIGNEISAYLEASYRDKVGDWS